MNKKEAIKYLESLVGRRVTMNSLTEMLQTKFGNCTPVEDCTHYDSEEFFKMDDNWLCNVDTNELFIDIDFYVLPTKSELFYITEVGYEFDDSRD